MNKEQIIDFLLDNADPSIILRIKNEILNCITKNEEANLIDRIMLQKITQIIINSQKSDGWFGNGFHGQSPSLGVGMYDNMEVGLRYLSEKGFPPDNEFISKAINSFLSRDPFDSAYGSKAPEAPDTDYTYTASGLYLARSSIILRAGYEYCLPQNSFIDLDHDVNFALKTFINVLNFDCPNDALDTSKRKLCFKQNVLWPCLYHLRILAHSQQWRNNDNNNLFAESISRLYSFSYSDEMVYTYKKGQYIGPCFAFIHQQGKILGAYNKDNISLDIMELFARCGIIKYVTALNIKYEYLLSLVDDELNVDINIDKNKIFGWSPYFGFALEESWKNKKSLQCDLLFRILLIMHYVELQDNHV